MTRLMRDQGFFFHIGPGYAQSLSVRRSAVRIDLPSFLRHESCCTVPGRENRAVESGEDSGLRFRTKRSWI